MAATAIAWQTQMATACVIRSRWRAAWTQVLATTMPRLRTTTVRAPMLQRTTRVPVFARMTLTATASATSWKLQAAKTWPHATTTLPQRTMWVAPTRSALTTIVPVSATSTSTAMACATSLKSSVVQMRLPATSTLQQRNQTVRASSPPAVTSVQVGRLLTVIPTTTGCATSTKFRAVRMRLLATTAPLRRMRMALARTRRRTTPAQEPA